MNSWREWLTKSSHSGEEIVNAIRPRVQNWVDARDGISFRTAQILSGHGCFGRYLYHIGRENTSRCWHCDAHTDTSRHTLEECPAWNRQRRQLIEAVGRDLILRAIVEAMLSSEEKRGAIFTFCEEVIARKEDNERARRREGRHTLSSWM
ncbi:PREDICTED: uncharacterized protein LOC105151680 [Acromyrmex echinatior]|uniref:uncharacterized protein LOC105151680 n=1 Tax=Acromyrmex echinatior TaxID=103372 RepID=UPI000580C334|nr:PREDICTED: uncharacterized protein LOC105151680 [Acromyrmex echinatior]